LTALQRIGKGIERHFSLVFLAGLIVGLAWQDLAAAVQPTIRYGLMAVIYIGFLKVDLSRLRDELRSWGYHLYLLVLLQLLIPAAMYFALRALTSPLENSESWSLGMLISLAVPAGAVTPSLCLMFKARFERALLVLVTTSMSVPITLPLLLRLASGEDAALPLKPIAIFLTTIVVLPAVGAAVTRRFAPPVVRAIEPRVPLLSVIILSSVVIGAVAGLRKYLVESPALLVEMILISTASFAVAYAIGWFAAGRPAWQDRMTVAVAATWTNVGLGIVIANEFFAGSLVLLFVVGAEIAWNVMFVPGQWIAARFNRKDEDSVISDQ
jgi:BASS family bile acid:Na+ symporter